MRKILLLDPEKCVACRLCEMACSILHGVTVSPVKSMIGIINLRKAGVNIPVVCQQCVKPLCADACPTGALSRNEETGAMVVDSDLCIACRMCTTACPLGGIAVDSEAGYSVKCDLCGGDPLCVKVCGYGAIRYLPEDVATLKRRRDAVKKLGAMMEKIVV